MKSDQKKKIKTRETGTKPSRKGNKKSHLVSPFDSIGSQGTRRKIQIQASLILVMIISLALGLIVIELGMINLTQSFIYVLLFLLAGFIPLYFLSRTKIYRLATLILLLLLVLLPFIFLISQGQYNEEQILVTLSWLIIAFLVSIPLLSLRSTVVLVIITIGAISVLPLIVPEISYRSLIAILSLLGTSGSLIIANLIYRERIIEDRNQDIFLERRLFDEVQNDLPGIFFMYTLSGYPVRWNKRFEEIVDHPSKELHNFHLTELFRGRDNQVVENMVVQAHAEGKAEGEIDITLKDGGRISYYLTIVKRAFNGKDYLLGFGIDLTEFKRVEEARHAVVDNSLQGLAIYLDGKIVFSNPANAKMFGYSESELYAMNSNQVLGLIHLDDRSGFIEHMEAALKQEKTALRVEMRVVRKDGSLCWMDVCFNVINYLNQTAIQAASVDITERKNTEAEQSRLISELEAKNAELERFTYTVSHDLKSPLITIRGFLGFLERDAIANNKARILADLQRITEATDQMQRLLNDLLKLSRIGHVVNPPEDLPFEVIVNEGVERVGGQILQRGTHIKINEGLPMVRVDRERAVEIVQNLVDNAVKFMGDRSDPQIEIGTCGTEGSGMSIFFVRDNGIGIDPQFHDRIFGLFNKLDPTSEGTGVGLALVKRIIEVHGGKIWVISKGKGDGTTFYFTLPQAPTTK